MNSVFRLFFFALIGVFFAPVQLIGQVPLNSDFSAAGRKRVTLDDYNQSIDMVVQPDGKAVLLTASGHIDVFFDLDVTLSRYNTDGSIDKTFGTNGVLKEDFKGMNQSQGIRLELLPDGSFLVMGSTFNWTNTLYQPVALMKVTPNGQIDVAFGDEGTRLLDFYGVQEFPTALEVDSKGRILVGGSTLDTLHGILEAISVARLEPDGQVDSTFGETGRIILVPDSGIYVLRHQSGGTLDGMLELPNGQILVIASEAKVDVLNSFFQLLNPNGTIDSLTWGQKQIFLEVSEDISDRGVKMELMADGRVAFGVRIFSRENRDFILGILDPLNGDFKYDSYDFKGQEDILADLALTPNGGLVAVGQSIIPENVSSIYKADHFAIAYFPDFTNRETSVMELVRYDEGHQGGAQTLGISGNDDLLVAGFTYTETPGNIDAGMLSYKLDEFAIDAMGDLSLLSVGGNYIEGDFTIRYAPRQTGTYGLAVYDITGRAVYQGENLNPGTMTFSSRELASGAYLAVLYQDGKRIAEEKFVVFKAP